MTRLFTHRRLKSPARRLVSHIVLCFAFASTTSAQTEQSGWPVEQRCISVPTEETPAADVPGTILLDGWAGIHAMQADWDTTHIVAFLQQGRSLGGALSPDGRRYAIASGFEMPTGVGSSDLHVQEIWLHNTADANDVQQLPYQTVVSRDYPPQMRWRDNERLFYVSTIAGESTVIDLATGMTARSAMSEVSSSDFNPSPDWTRALLLRDLQDWQLYQPETAQLLTSVTLADYPQIAWSQDSMYFAAEVAAPTDPDADNPHYALALFNRDGAQITSMFNLPERVRLANSFDYDVKDMVWSRNGRYIALITYIPSYPPLSSLYIIDTQEQAVWDTCLSPSDGLAWSPDGSQLALMAAGDEHRPLYVMDMESEQLSRITRHEGNVIGWREN